MAVPGYRNYGHGLHVRSILAGSHATTAAVHTGYITTDSKKNVQPEVFPYTKSCSDG